MGSKGLSPLRHQRTWPAGPRCWPIPREHVARAGSVGVATQWRERRRLAGGQKAATPKATRDTWVSTVRQRFIGYVAVFSVAGSISVVGVDLESSYSTRSSA
jgi:hypothetical protein